MASAVEICNLALSFLGDSGGVATINPPDSTTVSKMCAIYYPIAKSAMLEMHDWSFATKRQLLAKLSTNETAGWRGVYEVPSDCMRVIRVRPHARQEMPSWWTDNPLWFVEPNDANFEVMGGKLYTNAENPVATYLTSEVSEGYFSPTFATAFAYYLAMEIAGSRVKGEEGQKLASLLSKQFQVALSTAKTRDANQQRKQVCFTPSWIMRR